MIIAQSQITVRTANTNPIADETAEAISEFVSQYLEAAAEGIKSRILQDFSITVHVNITD
jgi:hypothetical protein